jgi:hypothetical protein
MSTRRRTVAWAVALAPVSILVALGTPSCSSKSSAGAGQLASGCSLNSDCADPLICIFALCHQACNAQRDCTTAGAICDKINGNGVCELPQEVACTGTGTSTCQQGLTCANQQCRTPCQNAATDCLEEQVCSSGACYDPSQLDAAASETGPASEGGTGTDGGGGTDATSDGPAIEAGALGYVPSNFGSITIADGGVPVVPEGGTSIFGGDGGIDWDNAPTVTITGTCNNTVNCLPAPIVITLTDGAGFTFPANLYVMKAFTVASSALLAPTDTVPMIFAVLGPVDVQGTISVTANTYQGFAGANSWGGTSSPQGPGAGGNGFTTNYPTSGGGGGTFCGVGGKGFAPSGTQAPGGSPYGNATITPLVAGSAGGYVDTTQWGAGGGALQISSGASIHIRAVGVITAGGGSAYGGGGSGGSILLEAPSIFIEGNVAANGGGGGGFSTSFTSTYGVDGYPSGLPAPGGVVGGVQIGGSGSAAAIVKGSDGNPSDAGITLYGGGGGGAGWIRLNSGDGGAGITGTLSPDLTTSCATQGTL